MKKPTVVCFGEVLWDMLPTGKVAGGAPMNVAYHLNNLGVESLMISQVGADDLGKELLAFLQTKGLTTDFVQVASEYPTSTVQVQLDEKGSPTYTIVENVAWDAIDFDAANYDMIETADALVYGSLAARNQQTRTTLLALLQRAKLKVFDLNLRKPFYSFELLEQLLHSADVVKLSDEELIEIAENQGLTGYSEVQLLQILKEKYHLQGILLTKGKHGALYLNEAGCYQSDSFPVDVVDTVGAGDAFLACFLKNLLHNESPETCLVRACALGAMVAARRGGTPAVSEQDIFLFVAHHEH